MGEAAAQGDGEAVIGAFAKVQQGCMGCHRSFRKRFVQHFHQQG
ncbi:MAG: cytochrome c [Xanthomonadales bacterium]|nr:cytochrome c [Xanthomonadales bacterium]